MGLQHLFSKEKAKILKDGVGDYNFWGKWDNLRVGEDHWKLVGKGKKERREEN